MFLLSIEAVGARWAVKHNAGILGYAKTETEAWLLVERLAGPPQPSFTTVDRGPVRYRHVPAFSVLRPATVLVVEDEALISLELAARLEELGLVVLLASDADEAWGILRARDDVEVLITDIKMPRGSMDGVRLARLASGRHADLNIIAVSGAVDTPITDLPEGCIFLTKPCAPEVLMNALAHMIFNPGALSSPLEGEM